MKADLKSAAKLHEHVPPNWYYHSLRHNLGQKIWHESRFAEVSKVMEPVSGKVLDIGCADGVFSKVILDNTHAKKVIGIDVLQDSIMWAKKHWKRNKKLSFKLGNAHDLKFPNNSFDAVFALEVMEHVPEPQNVFKEIKRVLTKNGYAVFLVPSDTTLFKIIWFFWTKFWRGRIWQDCHIQSFSKDNRLAEYAKKQGFKVDVDKTFLLGMLNVVKVKKK